MTNTIADLEKADVILVTGSNTTENHPVISSYIKRAVKFKNTKLIVVDPRRIKLVDHSETWLRPNPGTDVAWINGLMNVIISENLYDKAFVENRTEGFNDLKKTVEKFTPDHVESITGIPAADITATARLYGNAKPGSIVYCMGITQHISGTDNVKSLANLAMLCGNLGVEGGGVNPLRGQNNVQGACDMGGLPNVFTAYKPVSNPDAVKTMEKAWDVSGLSDQPGLTVTEMLPKAHDGSLKSLYIIGENPLVSDPDLNHAEKCLEHLDFMVVQDIFLTETARKADVVLPSLCFAEKDGTFTNTERRVQRVRKAVNGPMDVKTDWEIICEISNRMNYRMSYNSAEDIFEEIRKVTPSYAGITWERIQNDGINWPCPDESHPGTPVLHTKEFTCGKGKFIPADFTPPFENTDKDYPMILTTGRILYHYHTGTMTRKTKGLNRLAPECFVEISAQDADSLDLNNESTVKIASRRGEITAKVKISKKAVPGTVFIPFHFAESAANRLTNTALDPVAKIPQFKVCAVNATKAS
jgi:formate dehydrogenase alpha subunit